ncbi:MAG: hypothetical protein JO021_07265 [Alphaproteobacteria bacterium]|nr:hypothetical protein [Alphaproteobacteria bacterium]
MVDTSAQIGANAPIGRGAAGDTVIRAGSIIDNLVRIAHNVTLGGGCIIVAQAGVSGSATLEDHVVLGGRRA